MRFTSTEDNFIPGLAGSFEYIRETALINIIDSDSKCIFLIKHKGVCYILCSGFRINFRESDYSTVEGSNMLNLAISLQFRYNQNPFTVRLTPVTVDTAESMNLGFFINSDTITADSRARASKSHTLNKVYALV